MRQLRTSGSVGALGEQSPRATRPGGGNGIGRFRIPCRFRGRPGFVVLDQIRTIDRDRVARSLGRLSPATMARVLAVLQEMFAP